MPHTHANTNDLSEALALALALQRKEPSVGLIDGPYITLCIFWDNKPKEAK